MLDVQLEPAPLYSGVVVRDADGEPVPNAKVRFNGTEDVLEVSADNLGTFQAALIPDTYTVVAGAWGYLSKSEEITIPATGPLTITLEEGYRDEFYFDFGWESSGNASAGFWEWAKPQQSVTSGDVSSPGADISGDLGDRCYVTGNGGNAGSNDVDNGNVILRSPPIDLSDYNEPVLAYYAFMFNGGGQGSTPNDYLSVNISNGVQEVEVELIDESGSQWRPQSVIHIKDYIQPTANMRLTFNVTDDNPGHVLEAAIDVVEIYDASPSGAGGFLPGDAVLQAAPNPFTATANIQFSYKGQIDGASIQVFDLLGRLREQVEVKGNSGYAQVGGQLPAGTYIAVFSENGRPLAQQKIVKIK